MNYFEYDSFVFIFQVNTSKILCFSIIPAKDKGTRKQEVYESQQNTRLWMEDTVALFKAALKQPRLPFRSPVCWVGSFIKTDLSPTERLPHPCCLDRAQPLRLKEEHLSWRVSDLIPKSASFPFQTQFHHSSW